VFKINKMSQVNYIVYYLDEYYGSHQLFLRSDETPIKIQTLIDKLGNYLTQLNQKKLDKPEVRIPKDPIVTDTNGYVITNKTSFETTFRIYRRDINLSELKKIQPEPIIEIEGNIKAPIRLKIYKPNPTTTRVMPPAKSPNKRDRQESEDEEDEDESDEDSVIADSKRRKTFGGNRKRSNAVDDAVDDLAYLMERMEVLSEDEYKSEEEAPGLCIIL
jgi:hypothetical protein